MRFTTLSRISARPSPHPPHLHLRPRHLQLQTKLFPRHSSSSHKLPNIPIFQAIKDHDPNSLAVIHSLSRRTFTYGNLIGDVLRAREDLRRKAGPNLAGERIGFLAENSYDYVGMFILAVPYWSARTARTALHCHALLYALTLLTLAVTMLSIFASNAIALPLSPAFPTSELQYIMDNSSAKVLLATEKYAEKADQVVVLGLAREPVFDIRSKLTTGADPTESAKLELEPESESDKLDPTISGMMLYTSGTTNRPV